MILTGDSGQGRKSVTFNRNARSRSVGTTGHVQTESAVKFARKTQSATVARKDGHQTIILQCGPVRYRVDAKAQSDARF